MDEMDIDSTLDVPDTPDRLKAQKKKGKRIMERGSNISASNHSGHCNHFADDARNGQKASDMASRKFSVHAPKSGSTKYDSCSKLAFASGNSSSSNNSLIFRRVPGDASNYENKHFQEEDNKMLYAQSPRVHVVDLAEQNGHVQVGKTVNPCTVQGNSRVEGYGRVPLSSTSRLPTSSGTPNSMMTLRSGNKGKEPPIETSDIDCDSIIGSLDETRPKAVKEVVSTPLNNISSSRVTGQKRLVRNGCISPHNIAKAKQVGMNKNDNIYVSPHHALSMVSSAPKESTTEHMDSRKSKGKGIMASHPLSVEEFDAQKTHNRNSICINEIGKEVSVPELGEWRSMRNQSKKMHFPVSEHQALSTERDDLCMVDQLPGSGTTGRKIGNGSETTNSFPMCQDSTSGRYASQPPPRLRLSNPPEVDKQKGIQAAKSVLTKRQRQGQSSSSQGESSSAGMGDSDIMFIGSSGTSKSSLTQTKNRNSLVILEPIIEIDEASPEVKGDGFSAAAGSATVTDAMARQIEADEMLARELQEQLYNEVPSVGVGEDDVYMATTSHQEESSTPVFPRRSHHVFSPRNSLISSSTRQYQPRSLVNTSRRSSQARGSSLNRMARFRSRFPGRSRTISSSRERNPVFPPDMDVDMRMYILEALEAFSDMGVDNSFLQAQREFNEYDYEMLLALDENNHLHGGATDRQINGLPQSTVQSDNFGEPCAICLETPTIGDMIRHLPCLHKFHKDCIDPWLRRKTSCPVCKSTIT